MTHRIVNYLDNPGGRTSYLREVDGDFQPAETSPYVVIAREYDELGKVVRAWFLSLHQFSDGQSSLENPPKHRIVGSILTPGQPTPPRDPMVQKGGDLQSVLHKLKQAEIKNILAIRQHETFCTTYSAAIQRAEQLESDLKTADENVHDLADRNANLASELQATKAELAALRESKSLWRMVQCKLTPKK